MAILAYDESWLRGRSPYQQVLEHWRKLGATFLWGGYPNDRNSWLVDRISGIKGVINGGGSIGYAGLSKPDGVDDHIFFPTIAGCGQRYVISILVKNTTTTDSGALFYIGNGSNGAGVGVGSTTMDNSGSNVLGVLEGVAWITSGALTVQPGIELYTFVIRKIGTLEDQFVIHYNGTANALGAYKSTNAPLAPTAGGIYINGYTAGANNRYAENAVIAAAVFANAPTTNEAALNVLIELISTGCPALSSIVKQPDLCSVVYW